jgi:hypothetical protein
MRRALVAVVLVGAVAFAAGSALGERPPEAGASAATDRAMLRELRYISRDLRRIDSKLGTMRTDLRVVGDRLHGGGTTGHSVGESLYRLDERLNSGVLSFAGHLTLADLLYRICVNTATSSARC